MIIEIQNEKLAKIIKRYFKSKYNQNIHAFITYEDFGYEELKNNEPLHMCAKCRRNIKINGVKTELNFQLNEDHIKSILTELVPEYNISDISMGYFFGKFYDVVLDVHEKEDRHIL